MSVVVRDVASRGRRTVTFRAGQFLVGMACWGLASTLLIRSELGLGPWDAFHVGLHRLSGLSVGVAAIVTGLVIVAVTLLMRIRPGIAILANTVLIGVFVDLLLPVVPAAPNLVLSVGYFAAGLGLAGLATGLYIGAGFGQGPRDALMIGLHERTGWSVRRTRTLLEASVLAAGWAMGGQVGLGTVLFALGIGPVVQWGLRTFPQPPPEPRDDVDPAAPGGEPLRRAA